VSSTAINLTISPGFAGDVNLDAIAFWHIRVRSRSAPQVDEPELSIVHCLARNAESEVLDQNNQWFCGHCREFVCAEKTLEVWSVPDVLIIQLKRFVVLNEYTTKSDVHVDYPNVLDMAPFVAGPQGGQDLRYRLYAVSEHSGGLGGGHYTAHAIVRSLNGGRGEWFWFDDSSASADREASAHNTYAYMLFYERLPEDDARTTTGDHEAASYD
jgi:ubiquitin carboxyl-terminal hydrolase 4/11/15